MLLFFLLLILFILILIYIYVTMNRYHNLYILYENVCLDNDLMTMEIKSLKQDLKTYKELLERNK